MLWYHFITTILILYCAIMHTVYDLRYSDLEELGKACPNQHKCADVNKPRISGCQCDSACVEYQDCCIDVQRQQEVPKKIISCLRYDDKIPFGVYAVSACSPDWKGPLEIKQKCEGILNFNDPENDTFVISIAERMTYKNLYCAECNNASIDSLKQFRSNLSCKGVEDVKEELKNNQISYNQETKKWEIYRMDSNGNLYFTECQLRFYIPRDLMNYVHLCQANMISDCALYWPLPEYKKLCKEYMAVVYDKYQAYRNPHCAICNNKTVSDLRCISRNYSSFPNLFDLKGTNGRSNSTGLVDWTDLININRQCNLNERYDPFSKKCRKLGCALPGYVISHGKCIRPN